MICKKIENVIEDLGVPMQVRIIICVFFSTMLKFKIWKFSNKAFIATTSDQYRKPSTGMWDLMINDYNDGK